MEGAAPLPSDPRAGPPNGFAPFTERHRWGMEAQRRVIVPLLEKLFRCKVREWDITHEDADYFAGIDKILIFANGRTATVACRSRTLNSHTERKVDITFRAESGGHSSELAHINAAFDLYVVTDSRNIRESPNESVWWVLIDFVRFDHLLKANEVPLGRPISNGDRGSTFHAVPLQWFRDHRLVTAENGPFPGAVPIVHDPALVAKLSGGSIRARTLDDFQED